MKVEAYAHIHDCQNCETLEWGLQLLAKDHAWDMFESYLENAVGVIVIGSQNSWLFEAGKGISGVFECLNNGTVVESLRVLKNIVKTEHVCQKTLAAAQQNFKRDRRCQTQ